MKTLPTNIDTVNEKSSKPRKKSDLVKLPSEQPQNDFLSRTVERLTIAEQDLWSRYQAGDREVLSDWLKAVKQLWMAKNKGAE